MSKVLIIAPEHMGYLEKVADNLKNQNIKVTAIHFPNFKYKNNINRVQNFFLKRLSSDIKFVYREAYIDENIKDDYFDIILVIRPDLISLKTLQKLKKKTTLLKAYFFDGIYRFPKKINTLPFFDEIYSFEPSDCKEFGFLPITNFIYEENHSQLTKEKFKRSVFNVTSFDKKRFSTLLKVAALLKENNCEYKIFVKTNKKISSKGLVEIIGNPISLENVQLLLEESMCMLDLSVIKTHKGLTFRVFEALGNQKKIITNNPDIANYDFYNPQNILIIDERNIQIPSAFFESDYEPIPTEIYQKYTLNSWVKEIFKEVLVAS